MPSEPIEYMIADKTSTEGAVLKIVVKSESSIVNTIKYKNRVSKVYDWKILGNDNDNGLSMILTPKAQEKFSNP